MPAIIISRKTDWTNATWPGRVPCDNTAGNKDAKKHNKNTTSNNNVPTFVRGLACYSSNIPAHRTNRTKCRRLLFIQNMATPIAQNLQFQFYCFIKSAACGCAFRDVKEDGSIGNGNGRAKNHRTDITK